MLRIVSLPCLFVLILATNSATLLAKTQQDWSNALARLEIKGPDPCLATKGICIEDDHQPQTFDLVHFAVDSTRIPSEHNASLNNLGKALQQALSDAVLMIVGHADSTGSTAYNQQLSEQRAASVARYLQTHFAIAAKRLQTQGRGETAPLRSNDNEQGRQLNRRVEFIRIGTDMGE